MKKWILLIVVAGMILGAVACLIMIGPQMKDQPNLRAYQARFPLPPAGVVPVEPAAAHALSQAEGPALNPLPITEQNLARGKVYYQYYCQMCHGATGDGNGPVGQSFVPHPADLRAPELQEMGDADLLDDILTASGHEPAAWPPLSYVEELGGRPNVLRYTVLPEHYSYLLLYVRSLGTGGVPATPPAPEPAK